MKLSEDDIYRNSTQFKHWSFTPSQLAAQRLQTNLQATQRVKAAVARLRAHRGLNPSSENASGPVSESSTDTPATDTGADTPTAHAAPTEVNCLTASEEQILLSTFSSRLLKLGEFLHFPIEVSATAIQFMRRFYLLNSCMTYDPQAVSRTIMFIANKVEDGRMDIETYAKSLPKVTEEDILAPEFMVMQGLRFDLGVWHPFRGLKGGMAEMVEISQGRAALLPQLSADKTKEDVQREMLRLPRKAGEESSATEATPKDMEQRITHAYTFASTILKSSALLTDAYFHYTPSQIWLSAFLLADEPLALFYLSLKTPPSSPTHAKLVAVLRACAAMLSSHPSYQRTHSQLSKEETLASENAEKAQISALLKKLKQCRDPDKIDLVKLNEARKRAAMVGKGEMPIDEGKNKKRKLARENFQKEADEFWGPELKKEGGEMNRMDEAA